MFVLFGPIKSIRLKSPLEKVAHVCFFQKLKRHILVASNCIRNMLEKSTSSEIIHFVRENQLPTIIGPEGQFYITDRHHLSFAMFQATFNFKRQIIHRVLCVFYDSL